MKQAELLRKLRKNKGVSQRQLAAGICAQSTLANFETKDQQYISSDFLFRFLDRLNVTVDEYQFLLNEGENEKVYYFQQINQYTQEKNTAALKKLYLELQQKFQESGDMYWLCYAFKAEEFYHQLQAEVFDYNAYGQKKTKEIGQLLDYLIKTDIWGFFEIKIFSNLAQYISTTYVLNILKELTEKVDLNYPPYRELIIKTLMNLELHFVEIDEIELVEDIASAVKKYFNREQLHWLILERFLADLCQELRAGKTTWAHYNYLKIYQQMGFGEYYQALAAFRKKQLSK